MIQLRYRGFRHVPPAPAAPAQDATLTYRGVHYCHTETSAGIAPSARSFRIYRGVAH